MRLSEIKEVADSQMSLVLQDIGMERDSLRLFSKPIEGFATVISGIRRCGKSTLMSQMIHANDNKSLYLNFDTPRLHGFTVDDFALLDQIASENKVRSLYFDEVQLVNGWESYVRSALDAGYRVTVTGSNATLLSRELGTRLTGRHITHELFPFSYSEFCRFTQKTPSAECLAEYLVHGGFPQYLRLRVEDVLASLMNDILYRDIAVRHSLRDASSLKNLMLYLIGNIGNLVSANKLVPMVQVKTAKTVLEYFSYIQDSYLVSFVPKFAYSYKAQLLNPKKVYCVDLGLHTVTTPSAQADLGRKLENMVYNELRRKTNEIFYYNENGHECDFVVCQKNKPVMAYQICYNLDRDNEEREVVGLTNAMENLKLENGAIITFDQEDTIVSNGRKIQIKPAFDLSVTSKW